MRFKSVIPDHSHKNDRTITSKTQGGRYLYENLLDFHVKRIISYFLDTFNVTLIIMIKTVIYFGRKGLLIFEGVHSHNQNNLSAMPLLIQH